jgi:AcrR family transcriptional regulator
LSSENQPKLSLRERKKAKTRAIIQQNALRLFHEQGYTFTTVEQIAEASEISPSTFFRYFPTKESVVLYDDYDPILIKAFQQQSKELNTIQAFRGAVKAGFANIPKDEKRALHERMKLVMSVPELRVASFNQLADTLQMIMEIVAEREGRDKSDQEIITLAGALMGAIISSQFYSFQHSEIDFTVAMDNALAFLEAGLPM